MLKFAADFLDAVANVVEPTFDLFGTSLDRLASFLERSERGLSSLLELGSGPFCGSIESGAGLSQCSTSAFALTATSFDSFLT